MPPRTGCARSPRVPRVLTLLAALLSAATVSACGGNDKSDAEKTVKEFVTATNKRDADKFCGDLVSKSFLEQTTGAVGDKAKDSCKQQFGQLKGLKVKLVDIKQTKVDGDNARVTATLEAQGERRQQTFRLKQEDGRFRLTGAATN
jgi:ABC-type glycerol-3-phosphate transport system substrate-binding protein